MPFQDLRELLDADPLPLPIGGTVYMVQPCSADDWLWLHARGERIDKLMAKGDLTAVAEGDDGTSEVDLYRRTLGSTFDQMLAGGVNSKELLVAGWTAFFWQLGNLEYAEAIWANAGKALGVTKPNRAARRAPVKKAPVKRASSRSTASRTPRATRESRTA
jgi:hypothetical protein